MKFLKDLRFYERMRSTQPRTIDYKNTSHAIYNLFQNKILIKILRFYFIPSLPRISFILHHHLLMPGRSCSFPPNLLPLTFFFQSQLNKRDSTLTSTANEFSFVTISVKNVEKRISLVLRRIPLRTSL